MTVSSRFSFAVAAVVLVVSGLLVGFIALIAMSSDSGDGIWNWQPQYAVGELLGVVSVTLICFGLGAGVRVVRNPRRLVSNLVALAVLLFGLFFASVLWKGYIAVGVAVAIGVVIYARVPSGREEKAERQPDDAERPTVRIEAPWLAAVAAGCLATPGWGFAALVVVTQLVVGEVVLGLLFVASFAAAALISKHPQPVSAVFRGLVVVLCGLLAGTLLSSDVLTLATVGVGIAQAIRYDSRRLLVARLAGVGALSVVAPAVLGGLKYILGPLLVALAVPATDYLVARVGQYRTATR